MSRMLFQFALWLYFASILTGVVASSAEYSQEDMAALIQIDKDMDIHNILNWNVPPDDANPGNGGEWDGVTWNDKGRVGGIVVKRRRALAGVSEGFNKLTELTSLDLIGCDMPVLPHMEHLTHLYWLVLRSNKLTEIENMPRSVFLKRVDLANNLLTDISPLENLTHIKDLYLHVNRIEDVSPLAAMHLLQALFLSHNKIRDLRPLTPLFRVHWYDPEDSKLTFQQRLEKTLERKANNTERKGIRRLYLDNNEIDDVTPLLECDAMSYIDLDNNRLRGCTR